MSITPSIAVDTLKNSSIPNSNGKIFYVGGKGPVNYTTIRGAMDDASDGDTIFVYDDSSPYYCNIVIDKSISLIGEDKNTTIINGKWSREVVYIKKFDRVTVSGFTIRGAEVGICLKSNNNIITDNIITSKYMRGGIILKNLQVLLFFLQK